MIDGLVRAVKIGAVTAISVTFMIAFTSFLNLIVNFVFGGVIGEILGIISVCLPFDAGAVFGAIATSITGIFGFMIASKIFLLGTSVLELT